ncbi:MAG: hypothetical protein QXE81_03930 [Desulfurococcaceae archaeon]
MVLTIKILVAGLIPYDSGKTWFTLSSAMYTRSRGLNTRVFKPIAGHSLWYSPSTIRKSIAQSILVGNDISLYYENGLVENPAIGNPIALATIPPDPTYYGDKIDSYFLEIEQAISTLAISRITDCSTSLSQHYYYPENIKKAPGLIGKTITKLVNKLKAEKSNVLSLLNYTSSQESEKNINICFEKISKDADILFIESFNDAATPYTSLISRVDYFIIVAPGRVLVYDNIEAIEKSIVEGTSKHGWEGLRTRYLVKAIKPVHMIETGFISKPRPRIQHIELINKLIPRND